MVSGRSIKGIVSVLRFSFCAVDFVCVYDSSNKTSSAVSRQEATGQQDINMVSIIQHCFAQETVLVARRGEQEAGRGGLRARTGGLGLGTVFVRSVKGHIEVRVCGMKISVVCSQ